MYGMEKLGIVLRSSSRLALVLEDMIHLAFQQETRSHASKLGVIQQKQFRFFRKTGPPVRFLTRPDL